MAIRPVYSKLLAAHSPASAATVYYGPPPAGTVWDLRSLEVCNRTAGVGWLYGMAVEDDAGRTIYAVLRPYARRWLPYHWDGRQIIGTDELVKMTFGEVGWSVLLSGYELTLP